MSYSVDTIPAFDNQLKKLVKKYPSLKNEYISLIAMLEDTPDFGIPLGNNCFKIIIAIESKGRGKSGGARVVSYLQVKEKSVVLLSIFDKSDQESISITEIKSLINQIP